MEHWDSDDATDGSATDSASDTASDSDPGETDHGLYEETLAAFPKLQKLGKMTILWMAFFYNPKHCGDRTRLNRLEEQVRQVMRLISLVKCALKGRKGKYECFRRTECTDFLTRQNQMLIDAYRDMTEEVNCRIAKMVVKKRSLLNILFFIFSMETDLAKKYEKDLKKLEDMVIDDTNDWMEILDFSETMKNPHYLNQI
jgi:hypothetical protein